MPGVAEDEYESVVTFLRHFGTLDRELTVDWATLPRLLADKGPAHLLTHSAERKFRFVTEIGIGRQSESLEWMPPGLLSARDEAIYATKRQPDAKENGLFGP